jgi:hypothetical protein
VVQNHSPRPLFLLLSSIIYAAFADADFWTIFGTFGTTEGNSNPNPVCPLSAAEPHVLFDLVGVPKTTERMVSSFPVRNTLRYRNNVAASQ